MKLSSQFREDLAGRGLRVLRIAPVYDPTRTTGLRARFVRQMRRRWKKISREMRVSIVDNDCFGIETAVLRGLTPIPPRQFEFVRSPQKIDGFMRWLSEMEEAEVLQTMILPGRGRIGPEPWSNLYIQTAYKKGVIRGRSEIRREMKRAGLPESMIPREISEAFLPEAAAFSHPVHAERVAAIYTRAFEDLKTVTAVTNSQVRRRMTEVFTRDLAQGIAEGRHPRRIAVDIFNKVNNRIDAVGIHRCTLIARTETIAAHHSATMGEYRMALRELQEEGLDVKIKIQAELSTSGNPCEICAAYAEGPPLTLDEVEGLIPVHPN